MTYLGDVIFDDVITKWWMTS